MSRPLISHGKTWAKFEKCILETFSLALKILHTKSSLPFEEDKAGRDSLNRRLEISFRRVIKEWEDLHDEDYPYPLSLKRNNSKQPDLDNEEVVNEFESKIPDFQLEFKDRLGRGKSLNEYFKNYDIECKRLGIKMTSGRSLSKEYVVRGVIRFIKNTHCYGQYTSSGMMIGYVQGTDMQTILDEINDNTSSFALSTLVLSPEGWTPEISRLDQRIDRSEVQPTPFDLRHIWVDLRHQYDLEISVFKEGREEESAPKK